MSNYVEVANKHFKYIYHTIIDVFSKRLKELLSCSTRKKVSQQLQHDRGSIIVKVISLNEVDALAL